MPRVLYQIEAVLAQRLTCLRPAQIRGLALWVYGTVLAGSACQNAVIGVLCTFLGWHSARQRLREWLYDGVDKARPTTTQVEVRLCFAPLLAWALSLWAEPQVVLAIDSTHHKDKNTVLVVSLLFRACALPVAWQVLLGNQPGEWMPPILGLLACLQPALPADKRVLVLTDRGLWSPRLFRTLKRLGLHPLMRIQADSLFRPTGQSRQKAAWLVAQPDQAWIGTGIAFKPGRQLQATLVAVWLAGQPEPCLCLSDLRPRQLTGLWYALRMWIEAGFRCLKRLGWQWHKTQRSECVRVARHFLVLAVATIWTLGCGSRVEDALSRGLAPARVLRPRPLPSAYRRRRSVFAWGLQALRRQMQLGRLWRVWWLGYAFFPEPAAQLQVTYHEPT